MSNNLLDKCLMYGARIGNTPCIRMKSLEDRGIKIFMKMEGMNITGSAKDRSAYSILNRAIAEGKVKKDTTVIESSSGNFGIAMAALCKYLGLKFVCVCDIKTTEENLKILKAYGADTIVVEKKDPITNEYLPCRLELVNKLSDEIENCFVPNQYGNISNPIGHEETIREIIRDLGNVDYIFAATSTFGTIRGYADYKLKNGLNTKIIAVDAEGSVLFDKKKKERLIPGYGAACIPALFSKEKVDDYILVNDVECINGCKYLLNSEGILSGGSTGGIVSGILKYINNIRDNSTCVFIMHDRGDRYVDTIYSEKWINSHIDIGEK